MSIPGSALPLLLASPAGAAGYEIERSLRFNSADSASLSRTPGSAGNRKTWTWSGWVKRAKISANTFFFDAGTPTGTNGFAARFNPSDQIQFDQYGTGSNFYVYSTALFRDPSAWYHVVCVLDTTQGTDSNRIKVYVNGVQQTLNQGTNWPASNADLLVNSTIAHGMGVDTSAAGGGNADMYLADVHFIDGQALDATNFGEFDDNGVWQPIEYAGSFSGNSFHLDFADNSSAAALGYDAAGSNDWTVNNIAPGGTVQYSASGNWSTGNSTVQNPGNAFDGLITTEATCNYTTVPADDWLQWSYSLTASTSLRFYIKGGPIDQNISINGLSSVAPSGNGRWLSLSEVYPGGSPTFPFSFSSIRITPATSSRAGRLGAVEVDGIVLADPAEGDSFFDSPTNGDTADDTGAGGEVPGNYCTWNPLTVSIGSGTIGCSNGNLGFGTTASSSYGSVISTIAPSSGKFYCELSFEGSKSSSQNRDLIGIVPVSEYVKANRTDVHRVLNALTFDSTGSAGYAHIGTGTSYTSTSYGSGGWNGNSIVGIAIDFDTPSVVFYVDGVSQGTFPHSMVAGESYAIFAVDWDNNVGITNYILNAGQRAFAYQNAGVDRPSADYKAVCTANLDTPTIEDGSTAMDVVTYSGDSVNGRTVGGLNFQPSFAWIKTRSNTGIHALFDAIRGTRMLTSSGTNKEDGLGGNTPVGGYVSSFTSDGFELTNGSTSDVYVNESGYTYVGWTWDGGSSTVSNTDGSITSSVRANASAGFSIVSWVGNGTSGASVGHGLGVAPSLVITKNRDDGANNWNTWHSALAANEFLILNSTNGKGTDTEVFGNTVPSSSVFYVGVRNNNTSGEDIIAYCFAPVEGYSAFGSYTGNGSTDGPFVYTGFKIKFLMIKIYSGTTSNWVMLDSARDPDNVVQNNLYADASDAENQFDWADFLSNGFKLRVSYSQVNGSGYNYLYCAFAENPFRSARAR